MSDEYHLRRKEKGIKGRKEIIEILKRAKYLTMATCRDGEPYLFTVSHGIDSSGRFIVFHCAKEGKKIDFLQSNPVVWGQAIEDLGYNQGECEHSYRTAQFRGRASFVVDLKDKRNALHLMIDRLEEDPETGKREFIDQSSLRKVCIVKVKMDFLSGKESKQKG